MTVTINNYIIHVVGNHNTGRVVGEFTNDKSKPKVYGDSFKEVLDQVEEIIREGESV